MSHYKPYPAYKDSGIEWIGEVPEHWTTPALKFLVSVPITDGPHETPTAVEPDEGVLFISAEAVSSGEIEFQKAWGYISRVDHERYSKKYKPAINDIYMVKSGATTGVTAIVEDGREFNIWSPLAAIRANEKVVPRFLLNALRSVNFRDGVALNWSYGTQQNIGMKVLETLQAPLPSVDEQHAIAAALDRETARIDALIAKKIRFIELLKEKRQALITHAVTKGFDSNVKMKDSGVEWIGEVPEHWEVRRIKFAISTCRNGVWGDDPTGSDDTPCVRVADFDRRALRVNQEIPTLRAIPHRDRVSRLLRRGNLLLEKSGGGETQPVGQVVLYDHDAEAVCSNFIARIELVHQADSSFWCYQFAGAYACGLNLRSVKQTSGIQNLDQEQYLDEVATCPPPAEQTAIAAALDRETARIDALIAKASYSITLLKERRSALITAAVTGQIDLRDKSWT